MATARCQLPLEIGNADLAGMAAGDEDVVFVELARRDGDVVFVVGGAGREGDGEEGEKKGKETDHGPLIKAAYFERKHRDATRPQEWQCRPHERAIT